MDNYDKKKLEGKIDQAKGTVTKAVGKLTGDDRTEAKGEGLKSKGEDKEKAAEAAGQAKGKLEEVAGKVQEKVGEWTDSDSQKKQGKARKIEGQDKQQKHA